MIEDLISQYLPDSIATTVATVVILVFVTSVLFLVGRLLVLPTTKKIMKSRGIEEHAMNPLMKVSWFIVLLVSITVGFGVAGLGNFLTALATISAAGTLAVGFAMQNVIKNFVSGVFIFVDKPFKIGDWIEWNGHSGRVEDIELRVTKIRTFDNELLTVPNSDLADNPVKNPVDADKLRLRVNFGIGYEDDIAKASEIILEEARSSDMILSDPEPSIRLSELGDSAVGLQSRVWISDPDKADYVKTKGEFSTSVKQRFDEEDINMPYPQRDVSGELKMPTQ